MSNLIKNITEFALYLVQGYVSEGDVVVDATCGNGYDTLRLAQLSPAKLYAFDIQQEAVDAIKGNYAFEKDAEYQRIGNYLHPSQVIEKNLHRSYLRFQVDENGVMSMTSIYCGPHNIHHLAVKVTAPDGSFAETPASKDSYETTDLGEKIEKADYKVGEDGNVIAFLNLNKDKNIRVNYLGERSYATTMTPNDRKAVAAVYELAQLLSAITEIKKNKDEANLKIEFVKRKMAEREGREKE